MLQKNVQRRWKSFEAFADAVVFLSTAGDFSSASAYMEHIRSRTASVFVSGQLSQTGKSFDKCYTTF
jgi:hypothetical protein